jgi:putative ABC transport system permease protein
MSALLLALRLALTALRRNPMRAGLTVIGLVIAVASLTVVSSAGVGAREQVAKQFNALGTNVVRVFPDNAGIRGTSKLGEGDAVAIARDIPGVKGAAPDIQMNLDVEFGGKTTRTWGVGSTRAFFSIRNVGMVAGEGWSEIDEQAHARVVVLGLSAKEAIFGDRDPIGQIVRIQRQTYRVIGVHARMGVLSGNDFDDEIVMPLTAMRTRLAHYHGDTVSGILVSAESPAAMASVDKGVRALLRQRHGLGADDPPDFRILNQQQLVQDSDSSYDLLTTLLSAVAAISFVVGGIGVMNVMLIGVAERKREIGICLAIGASPVEIATQFLFEAVALSIIGGLLGLVLGIVGSIMTARGFGWSSYFDTVTLTVGLAAAFGTGVTFGFFPALRASRLDPVVAMRRD